MGWKTGSEGRRKKEKLKTICISFQFVTSKMQLPTIVAALVAVGMFDRRKTRMGMEKIRKESW